MMGGEGSAVGDVVRGDWDVEGGEPIFYGPERLGANFQGIWAAVEAPVRLAPCGSPSDLMACRTPPCQSFVVGFIAREGAKIQRTHDWPRGLRAIFDPDDSSHKAAAAAAGDARNSPVGGQGCWSFRGIATRYDKAARNHLAAPCLVSAITCRARLGPDPRLSTLAERLPPLRRPGLASPPPRSRRVFNSKRHSGPM